MKRASTAVFAAKAHSAFRKFVFDPEFSCLGGKAATNEKTYRFGTFEEMGTKAATRELSYQLFDFARSGKKKAKLSSSFVAIFRRPLDVTEGEFEVCLWLQLRRLHLVDPSEWDSTVNTDPENPHRAFSFGGRGFYVLGMHANSSRAARRFRWPTLVFNPHE